MAKRENHQEIAMTARLKWAVVHISVMQVSVETVYDQVVLQNKIKTDTGKNNSKIMLCLHKEL